MTKLVIGALGFILLAPITSGASETTLNLLDLAKRKFGAKNLTAAEKELFRATQAGERASLNITTPLNSDHDANDPKYAINWDASRIVRADRLAWLCTDPTASALVTYHGIVLFGLRIEGDLDLKGATVQFPFEARQCAFTGIVEFEGAKLRSVNLALCQMTNVFADQANINGGLSLTGTTVLLGTVSLAGARIVGNLHFSTSEIWSQRSQAIIGDSARIEGAVFLRDGFEAHGEVRFPEARISGDLDCTGANLSNAYGDCLSAERARIDGSVFLIDQTNYDGKLIRHFQSSNEVDLTGTDIGGDLDCAGAQLSNPNGTAHCCEFVAARTAESENNT